MKRRIHFPMALFAALFFAVSFIGAKKCRAEPILFGPTPYLSAADSPFDLSGLGTTFFLEDFEDGLLNTPGASTLTALGAPVRMPGSMTDSVDGDDGQIDGDGTLGHSLESNITTVMFSDPPKSTSSLLLNFDPVFDGRLPSIVGFVLTDSSGLADITWIAFDEQGGVISSITESGLDDGLDNGGTEEDRFFGLIHADGISSILIESYLDGSSESQFEIDHLQYGIASVPEPSSWILLLVALCSFGLRLRIRRADKEKVSGTFSAFFLSICLTGGGVGSLYSSREGYSGLPDLITAACP